MKKGEFCIKVLSGAGHKTAVVSRIESIKNGVVRIEGSSLKWREDDGMEIDPAIPGFYTQLVEFDGGEVERWDFAGKVKARS